MSKMTSRRVMRVRCGYAVRGGTVSRGKKRQNREMLLN